MVGLETGDDGAVIRLTDEIAIIQTVDFFMPVVDDPTDFGRIAAANALSDVYAMGGEPISALAILGLPIKKLPAEVGALIMAGAGAVCAAAGVQIVGGHSIDDTEPKFGLSVTGRVHPDAVWRNSTGQAGDKLILTKALGTGCLTTAIKRGALSEDDTRRVIEIMASLNQEAGAAGREVGVSAATDVTGFSLLGHSREMADGAGLGLDLVVERFPVIPGARAVLAQGIAPGATARNLAYYGADVVWDDAVTEVDRKILGDPQTSGGLLFAVAPHKAAALVAALSARGTGAAHIVGELSVEPGVRVHARGW
jgi:selenide,water dikinase